jgi:hypothetical protein
MTLQTSGAISQGNLQTEYGGANPISANEYYRGGAYVNTTRSTSSTVYSSWYLNCLTYGCCQQSAWYDGTNSWYAWKWNGAQVTTSPWPNSNGVYTFTTGGYTYYHGKYNGGYYLYTNNSYSIRRSNVQTSTIDVNTTVPSSGTISLNQYYGQGN